MAKTTKALPNQSLLDMILTEYGTLEAGMEVAAANNIPLSDAPATGNEIEMPAAIAADPESVRYLRRNNITLGTLATPALTCEIILKPRIRVEPNTTGNPHVIGYYAFDVIEDDGFVCTGDLAPTYPSANRLHYITEERYLTGLASQSSLPLTTTPMPGISVPYQLSWTVGLGYMMVYSDMAEPAKTITFSDTDGNEAFAAPVTILDNVSQSVVTRLLADIQVEIISSTASAIKLRLTRLHPPVGLTDYSTYKMYWMGAAAGGVPDPLDENNTNKTIVTLPPGIHNMGVKTTYYYVAATPPQAFPSSAFSMVVRAY